VRRRSEPQTLLQNGKNLNTLVCKNFEELKPGEEARILEDVALEQQEVRRVFRDVRNAVSIKTPFPSKRTNSTKKKKTLLSYLFLGKNVRQLQVDRAECQVVRLEHAQLTHHAFKHIANSLQLIKK
jgi:hypothetical protein